LRLRPGDALALPLKHHFALECRYRADHREQELAGRRTSVHAEIEYMQVGPLELDPIGNLQKVSGRAGEPI
jgi:hypothetical protein